MTPILTKQPGEKRLYDMEFRKLLGAGVTLSAVSSAAAVNQGNVSGSSDITLGTTSISGTVAQVWVEVGGTNLEDYKVTLKCTTSIGETVEGDGILQVREL